MGQAHRNERQLRVVIETINNIEATQVDSLLEYYSQSSLEVVRLWTALATLRARRISHLHQPEKLSSIQPSSFQDQAPLFIESLVKLGRCKRSVLTKPVDGRIHRSGSASH